MIGVESVGAGARSFGAASDARKKAGVGVARSVGVSSVGAASIDAASIGAANGAPAFEGGASDSATIIQGGTLVPRWCQSFFGDATISLGGGGTTTFFTATFVVVLD